MKIHPNPGNPIKEAERSATIAAQATRNRAANKRARKARQSRRAGKSRR